jgi:arylformamidase
MKYIDLTLAFNKNVVGFDSEPARLLHRDGWNATSLQIYSHAGTHMDAPTHFNVNEQTIDQIPLENFFSKRTWVVRLLNLPPSFLIKLEDVLPQLDDFQMGDSIIIRTDWSKRLGADAENSYRNHLPRISEELANWMVANEVNILGVEPPSIADVNNMEEVTKIHKILLGHVIIVEGLCNLDMISKNLIELIALPLKIEGCDGSPCRVISIENY